MLDSNRTTVPTINGQPITAHSIACGEPHTCAILNKPDDPLTVHFLCVNPSDCVLGFESGSV